MNEPPGGWNWLWCTWQKVYCISTFRHSLGLFSGVMEGERWSQTLPITLVLLIYHPLPLWLDTHTLPVRRGLSSRLQFQSWSVLQQQSRGFYTRSSMARLQETTAKPLMENRRIRPQPVNSQTLGVSSKPEKRQNRHCPPLSRTRSPLTSPATSTTFNPRPF